MSLPDYDSLPLPVGAFPGGGTTSTPEGIAVPSHVQGEGLPHLGGMPGAAPFVRGPYPTMYAARPWTVRQYAGFSTAEESPWLTDLFRLAGATFFWRLDPNSDMKPDSRSVSVSGFFGAAGFISTASSKSPNDFS